jgi:hypothetical protein
LAVPRSMARSLERKLRLAMERRFMGRKAFLMSDVPQSGRRATGGAASRPGAAGGHGL